MKSIMQKQQPVSRRACLAGLGLVGGSLALMPAWGQETAAPHTLPVRGVYGINSNRQPFQSMKAQEIPTWLADHGVNTVFVKTSESVELLAALREAGIRCYVSMTCFASRSLYEEHPEWRPITAAGEEMQPDGWYHGLCPAQPDLRERRLAQFEELLENPHLDGVWLDFIRYPVRWEGAEPRIEQSCFAPHSLQAFAKHSGLSLPQDKTTAQTASWILNNHLPEWTAFKIEVIRSWVEQARQRQQEKRPEMTLGLFSVPWTAQQHDQARRRIVAQDYPALAPHVDVFSPMVYHRMIEQPVGHIADVTREALEQSGKQVWPIIQAMNMPDELPAAEFRQSVDVAAQASQTGVLIFTARYIEEAGRWPDVKRLFAAPTQ